MEFINNYMLSNVNENIKNWCEEYNCYLNITYNYKGEYIFRDIFGGHENISHFKTLTIPEGIHSLLDGAFIGNNWENLTSIFIPSTMKIMEKDCIHRNRVIVKLNPETIDRKLLQNLIENDFKIEFRSNPTKAHNISNIKDSSILLLNKLYKKHMTLSLRDIFTNELYLKITSKIVSLDNIDKLLLIFKSIINIYKAYDKYIEIAESLDIYDIKDDELYHFDSFIINRITKLKKESRENYQTIISNIINIKEVSI